MVKPDDSSLDADAQRAVEDRATRILNRASAWDRFPTPVEDIVAAANLRVASSSAFDPRNVLAYIQNKTGGAVRAIKSALSKVFGLCDSDDSVIHIDDTVHPSKQNFLKLHETGHHEIPTHRKLYRFFLDCDQTLSPEIADRFEREANNFARFALFQGDTYRQEAADCRLDINTPLRLAKRYGASAYASVREFARTHHKACVVYALESVEMSDDDRLCAPVRRIETSPPFRGQFDIPPDTVIGIEHALFCLIPFGRRMTPPTRLTMVDRNGARHECVGEGFRTPYNIFLLVYPVRALTATSVIVPSGIRRMDTRFPR